MSVQKTGKVHEHNTLHKIIKRGGEWDTELDSLMTKNQKKFESDFKESLKRMYSVEDFRRYLSHLTSLERFFLGV